MTILGGPTRDFGDLHDRVLRASGSPYFCHRDALSGRWAHYAAGHEPGDYVYMGHCADIPHEFGQPHDHGLDDDPLGARRRWSPPPDVTGRRREPTLPDRRHRMQ